MTMRRIALKSVPHLAYAAAAAVILVLGVVLYNATVHSNESAVRVSHSLEVIETVDDVNEMLARAESAQRGYVLTSFEAYLSERDQALAGARARIAAVKNLTSDDAHEQSRVSKLETLLADRVTIMHENEQPMRIVGSEAADTRMRAGLGHAATVKIYDLTNEMEQAELGLLTLRRAEEQRRHENNLTVLNAAVVISLVILIPGYIGFLVQSRARERAERKLSDMADSLPGAAFRIRTDGDVSTSARFEFVSASVEQLFGIKRGLMLQGVHQLWGCILEEDKPAFVAALESSGQTCAPLRHDFRIKHANGETRWIRATSSIRKEPDGSFLWNGYWSDVSSQRLLEHALQEAKEAAEAANRVKSIFLATMSHEIRTPMNGVLGMLQLVETTELDPLQRRHIGIARDSAESLTGLLDTIIDFARLDTGIDAPVPHDFDPADLLEAVIELMRPRALAKGIALRLDLADSLPDGVNADSARLRQVLVNLISNAVKFTDAGAVTVTARINGTALEMTVGDTGIGIPEEALGRIFDEFTQADSGISRRYGGTGLGLAVCRRIVELIGGSIAVESVPGQGSSFQVTVPVGPSAAPQAAGQASAPRRRLEVLVVEDDPINQIVASGLLAQLGHSATIAEAGEAALDIFARSAFDLVLMDLHMPGLDGIETTKRLRGLAGRQQAAVPVVALTADLTAADDPRLTELGFAGVVTKPVRRAALDAALRAATEHVPGRADAAEPGRLSVDQPVDQAYLAEQAALLGVPAMARLYRLFRASGRASIAELVALAEHGDVQRVGLLAHRLASSSATLGLGELQLRAECLEHAASGGDGPILPLAAGLAAVFERAYAALIEVVRAARTNRPAAAGAEPQGALLTAASSR